MTTPGSVKRYLSGAWAREGSFILYVPDVVSLPASPDEDGVYAWVEATQTLYYSYGGTWHPYSSGSAPATPYMTRATVSANYALGTSGFQAVKYNTVDSHAADWDLPNFRWVCPTSGTYQVSVVTSVTLPSAGIRVIGTIYVNGVEAARGSDYSAGASGSLGGGAVATDVLTLVAGDKVQGFIYTNPVGTNVVGAIPSITYMTVRLLAPTGSQGPTGPAGPPGQPFAIYPDWASLPQTGVATGAVAITQDTGTAWVWTGTYWRPQIAASSLNTTISAASIPVTGNTVMGTISIPAAPYPRLVIASASCIFGGPATVATYYQLFITHVDGGLYYARCACGNFFTATVAPTGRILQANTAGTLTATASYTGGTSAASSTSIDGRYNHMEATIHAI